MEASNFGQNTQQTPPEGSLHVGTTVHITAGNKEPPKAPKHGVRFWGIFVSLCLLSFISALDVAIVTTALPTVVDDIGGGKEYVWIANSFVVASCVPQPLFGQLADAFGRRIPIITSTVLFALGSGIGGGANSAAMLIAGRVVQGVSAGGIYVLLDVVCCDLVPQRERGKYLGLMFSWSGVAAALGPPVGGAIAEANWRWIFYMNIPICGVALACLLIFMRVNTGGGSLGNVKARAKKLDYLGTLIFVPSMISLLIGLVEGGTEKPWSSWRIIVPLVLGVLGWIAFHIQQFFTSTLSVPPRLFANRTSATALFLAFTSSVLVQAPAYFLPIYFQAVKGTTALKSGTYFLPFALGSLVFAVISGTLLSKFGVYQPLHAVAFALSAIGFGLFTLLGSGTPKVAWAFYQLIASAGAGFVLSVLLPAIMAPLPEKDVALASATYSFLRTFGYIWGVTIPAVIFNGVFNNNLQQISYLSLRRKLEDGAAYSFASQAHVLKKMVDPEAWSEVIGVYTESLKAIWWFCLALSLFSLLAVGLERRVKLRKELDTDYGIDEKKDATSSEETGEEKKEDGEAVGSTGSSDQQ